jgi:hypothetical protein
VLFQLIILRKLSVFRKRLPCRIRRLGVDYGYIGQYRHVTATEYRSTWTSSVEAEALEHERYLEDRAKKMGLQIDIYKPSANNDSEE